MCVTYKAKWRWQVSLVSVRKLASQERVSGEKRMAVKPLLNVQCPSTHEPWKSVAGYFTPVLEVCKAESESKKRISL